jgi:dynein heavy chain
MSSQFDAAYLEKNVLAPLLEIQMDLVSKSVVFVPEVGLVAGGPPSGPKSGIKNIVEHWIEGMFGLSSAFPRLDSAEGTYLREISEAANVRDQLAVANQLLSMAEDEANKIRKQFQGYDSLWMSDLQNDLAALLLEAVVVTDIKFVLESDLYQNDERRKSLAAGSRAHRPSISVGDDVGETWQQTKLNLVLFGAKVTELLKTQDEISEMKSVYEIVFLKVNAQPVKQAISTWVTKGLYTYTHYLQNFISLNLNDIYVFLKDTNVGLDRRVEAGQRETIMSLLSCIRAVRRRMPELSFCFRQLDEIVVLLKHHAIAIDLAPVGGQGALEFLELAKSQWEHLVNKAFRVKESLQPLQTNMLDGIIKEVAAFEKTLDAALKSLRNHGPYQCAENKKNEPYAVIDRFYKELSQLSEQYKAIIETEDLFELPKSRHQQLAIYSVELNCIKQAWDMYFVIEFTIASWRQTLWNSINCDSLLDESRAMYDQLKRFPPLAKEWDVFKVQEARLRNTMITLPLVKDLHSAAIRERHWKSVAQVTGVTLNRGPAFALEDLLAANIHLHLDVLSDIVEVANKELKIETRLATIEEVWIKLSVGFEKHKETELLVIKPPDEILEVLDEHVLLLQNMAGMGKFVDFFREQVVEWQTTLGEVETNLKLLCTVTKLWASLESIFLGSDDIRTQLPEDASRFDQADVTFRRVMGEMQENTYAVDCLTFADRDVVLQQVLKKLEKCEYSLNEYLEVKKGIFPRFYFVSNAALLDILSNSNTPTKVGVYIGALFDGIGKLDFCMSQKQKVLVKNTKEAIPPAAFLASKAMVSKDKERIDFPSTFDMTGNVERWLNELVACMQQTLRCELETSMEASTVWDSTLPGDPREEWVFTAAAQICLLATQIVWTDDVEKALEHLENGNEDALKKYADKCSSRLDALIRLVQDDLDDSDRVKIINIITSDVHNRDVVLGLINKKVESAVDFNWQSQLRFYWDSDANDVTVKICDFVTTYSYEYIGNCNRLVITPLTDRCFVTLTVALKLFLGGAPAGTVRRY